MTTNTTTATAAATVDLATIEKLAIEKLNKSAAKSDLDALIMGARRSMLLIDVSGSMAEAIRSGGRKIDALRGVVKSLREECPVPTAAFGMNHGHVVLVESVPEPQASTPMAAAIEFAQREGANHAVIVTDGQPDSEGATFAAARSFGGPIDVFYVGDGNDRGAQFAKELAALTGGTANLADLGKPKELQGKITLLLGDGGL
jgi:hypothetical protein